MLPDEQVGVVRLERRTIQRAVRLPAVTRHSHVDRPVFILIARRGQTCHAVL